MPAPNEYNQIYGYPTITVNPLYLLDKPSSFKQTTKNHNYTNLRDMIHLSDKYPSVMISKEIFADILIILNWKDWRASTIAFENLLDYLIFYQKDKNEFSLNEISTEIKAAFGKENF